MKNRTSKLSLIITLLSTILIITIGYKALAFAGDFFLRNDTEISYLATDNLTTYVFYSQSEDELNLYPWNYYYDAVSFQTYTGKDIPASYFFDTWDLYNSLTYYFYRMIPEETATLLYEEDIPLYERMDYSDLANDLFVKTVNNEPVFYYSKDLNLPDQTYNLRFTFSYSRLLSFEIKSVSDTLLTDDQMNKSKQFLTDYINSDESNSIAIIYSDIFNQRGLYDTYSLINNSYNKDKYDMEISGNEDLTSGNESITKNSSYQLIENDNEFLIILLENNVVIHYDPLTSMITGFNFSESYMH